MPSPLEELHTLPESGAPALVANLQSRLAVIVTHPWGPLGGSLHNNVVSAVVLYFQRLGITTMRFNFAGSQIGRGNRQVSQVQEAAKYLLQGKHLTAPSADANENDDDEPNQANSNSNIDSSHDTVIPTNVLLVGYSYGALISGSASVLIPQCVAVILIALPISVQHWLVMFQYEHMRRARQQRPNLPRLLIMGSRDNFTSEEVFGQTVATFPKHSTTGAVLLGADHFFGRREKDVMDIIGQWLQSTFPECQGDIRRLANETEWNEENYNSSSPRIDLSNSTTTNTAIPYCGVLQFPMSSSRQSSG
jgi:alpha/beta superfamily hydrolase